MESVQNSAVIQQITVLGKQLFHFWSAICLHFQIAGDAGEVVDSAPNGEQIIEAKGVLVKTESKLIILTLN